jgi:hypothetical protein
MIPPLKLLPCNKIIYEFTNLCDLETKQNSTGAFLGAFWVASWPIYRPVTIVCMVSWFPTALWVCAGAINAQCVINSLSNNIFRETCDCCDCCDSCDTCDSCDSCDSYDTCDLWTVFGKTTHCTMSRLPRISNLSRRDTGGKGLSRIVVAFEAMNQNRICCSSRSCTNIKQKQGREKRSKWDFLLVVVRPFLEVAFTKKWLVASIEADSGLLPADFILWWGCHCNSSGKLGSSWYS